MKCEGELFPSLFILHYSFLWSTVYGLIGVFMMHQILIAGFGGQGVMLSGNILAMSSMNEGKEVTYFPSYGAEMRGGAAKCFVVISDKKIGSPIINRPSIEIIFNQISFNRYVPLADEKASVFYNSSLIKDTKKAGCEIVGLLATDTARELGDIRSMNMIFLGMLSKTTNIVKIETLEKIVKENFKEDKVCSINIKALRYGYEKGKNN